MHNPFRQLNIGDDPNVEYLPDPIQWTPAKRRLATGAMATFGCLWPWIFAVNVFHAFVVMPASVEYPWSHYYSFMLIVPCWMFTYYVCSGIVARSTRSAQQESEQDSLLA